MSEELPIEYRFLMSEELPTGYKFLPSDIQLVTHYLKKKVNGSDVPPNVIQDILASEFYSKPPSYFVNNVRDERRFYLFIHEDDEDIYFYEELKTTGTVTTEIGFWRSCGNEVPIYDEDESILAYKIYVDYFSTQGKKGKKTPWKMELWRLNTNLQQEDKWVLGRLKQWQH